MAFRARNVFGTFEKRAPGVIVLKCVPHVQHAYFSSPDRPNSKIVALLSPLTSFILSSLLGNNRTSCRTIQG